MVQEMQISYFLDSLNSEVIKISRLNYPYYESLGIFSAQLSLIKFTFFHISRKVMEYFIIIINALLCLLICISFTPDIFLYRFY
jgi:hypothetical protein